MSDLPLLELRGVTKRFSTVVANDNVSLSLTRGEILGILGENGAGKTTLMNILSGLFPPDDGEIIIDGIPTCFAAPQDAVAAGIAMVHQHFALIGAMTVGENLALGEPRWGKRVIDYNRLATEIGRMAGELAMSFDIAERVDNLSVSKQQQIEILKALSRSPRILILDEPTAILAPEERIGLFGMLERLKARGAGVILITHRMEDILDICDRVAVMRRGRVVDSSYVAGRNRKDLVRMVVGDDLPPIEHNVGAAGRAVLTVEDLAWDGPGGGSNIRGVSFALRAGEITGLCGVDGNGQVELIEILAGMLQPHAGKVTYNIRGHKTVGPLSSDQLRPLGAAHIPEDRLRQAVVPAFSISSNWLLTNLWSKELAPFGWLREDRAITRCCTGIRDYEIKANGPSALLRTLSGGNQQKIVLARELAGLPELILAAYPTRGLDVRTIAFVLRELLKARDRGAAILMLSSDLDEVWEIADQVMVLAKGHFHGPVRLGSTTRQEVGHWMTGSA